MSEQERVRVEVVDGVADVRLSRPEKRNALDPAMFEQIVGAGETLRRDPSVRVVVLSGDGPDFCAGLDFGSFRAMANGERLSASAQLPPSHGPARATGQRAAWVWAELEVPVIAAIQGNALGGGLQIALGADIRIVAPDARLSVMEVKWGLIPDMTGTQVLPELVGRDVAKELTLTARVVGGTEAAELGLCTRPRDRRPQPARHPRREAPPRQRRAGRPRHRLRRRADRDRRADRVGEPGRGRDGRLREARPGLHRLM
jgi:enoyl-CoA hydratase/carnithine racemase